MTFLIYHLPMPASLGSLTFTSKSSAGTFKFSCPAETCRHGQQLHVQNFQVVIPVPGPNSFLSLPPGGWLEASRREPTHPLSHEPLQLVRSTPTQGEIYSLSQNTLNGDINVNSRQAAGEGPRCQIAGLVSANSCPERSPCTLLSVPSLRSVHIWTRD